MSQRLDQLPEAGPLDGSELLYVVQDGNDRRIPSDTYALADMVDPILHHGATGDGSTDDGQALDDAISECKTSGKWLYLAPEKTFRTERSLFFGRASAGADQVQGVVAWGATILGACAGDPVVDYTGGHGKVVLGLRIEGDTTDIPSVGLLLARLDTGHSAAKGLFVDVDTAGEFTVTGLYKYASEQDTFLHCDFRVEGDAARTAGVVSSVNVDGVTSPHVTLYDGDISNVGHHFYHCRFDCRTTTPGADTACVDVIGAGSVVLDAPYFEGQGSDAFPGFLTRQTGGSRQSNDVHVRIPRFHGTWDYHYELRSSISDVRLDRNAAGSANVADVLAGTNANLTNLTAEGSVMDFSDGQVDLRGYCHLTVDSSVTFGREMRGHVTLVDGATIDAYPSNASTFTVADSADTGRFEQRGGRLAYAPSVGFKLDGTAGNYLSTPDSADYNITTELDLRVDMKLDSWRPADNEFFASRNQSSTDGEQGFIARVLSTGRVGVYIGHSGGLETVISSGTDPIPDDDARRVVRIEYTVDDGSGSYVARFFIAPTLDGPWNQLAGDITGTSVTPNSLTAALNLGRYDLNDDVISGVIYAAELRIDGVLQASPRLHAAKYPRFTDEQSRIWTPNGSAWAWEAA